MTRTGSIDAHRMVRGTAAAVLLALAWLVAPASATQAAPADPNFEWGTPLLLNDVDGDGFADVGDTVRYPFTLDASGVVSSLTVRADEYNHGWAQVEVAPGETAGNLDVELVDLNLRPDGSGMLFDGVFLDWEGETSYPSQPPALQGPRVTFGATQITVFETYGDTTDGKPAEGDVVVATVPMTHATDVTITIGGSTQPSFPGAGTTDVEVAVIPVTTAHMAAGTVPVPAASFTWASDGYSGAHPSAATSAATEDLRVAMSDLSVRFAIAEYGGTPIALSEIAVGDPVRLWVDYANSGNVSLNMVRVLLSGPGFFTSMSSNVSRLAPGAGAGGEPEYTGHYHSLTAEDIARGYVDITAHVEVHAASPASGLAQSEPVVYRVLTRPLVVDVDLSVDSELLDTNGDGIGQAGEKVQLTWTATSDVDSEQSVELEGIDGSQVVTPPTDVLNDVTLAPGETLTDTSEYEIPASWLVTPPGALGAALYWDGSTDGVGADVEVWWSTVPMGEYVAPPTSLAVAAAYDDANGDGEPSIGETTTFESTVTNTGTYPLTGLSLVETGLVRADALPSDTVIAPGASLTWSATHVITTEDFVAGSVDYGVSVDAEGLVTLSDSAQVDQIAFAAYESDLAAGSEGSIALCTLGGDPVTEAVPGTMFVVLVGGCDGRFAGDGAQVYMFSTPTLLGMAAVPLAVPADVELGDHRVAVYDADGALLGWAALEVVAPAETAAAAPTAAEPEVTSAELAETGVRDDWRLAMTAALSLVLIGFAFVGVSQLAPNSRGRHAR